MPATNPVTPPELWSQVAFLARAVITVNKVQSPITLAVAAETVMGWMFELKWLYMVWLALEWLLFLIKWCQDDLITYSLEKIHELISKFK